MSRSLLKNYRSFQNDSKIIENNKVSDKTEKFNVEGSGGEVVTSPPLELGCSRPTMIRARCLRIKQYYLAQKNNHCPVIFKQGHNSNSPWWAVQLLYRSFPPWINGLNLILNKKSQLLLTVSTICQMISAVNLLWRIKSISSRFSSSFDFIHSTYCLNREKNFHDYGAKICTEYAFFCWS